VRRFLQSLALLAALAGFSASARATACTHTVNGCVQYALLTRFGPGTATATLSSVVAGHTIFVVVNAQTGGGVDTYTLASSCGFTYTKRISSEHLQYDTFVDLWDGFATSSCSETVTFGTTGSNIACPCYVIEHSAPSGSSAYDGSNGTYYGSAGSGVYSSGNVTTTAAGDLCISLANANITADSFTAQSPYTASVPQSPDSYWQLDFEDGIVGAAGTNNATWSVGGASPFLLDIACYKVGGASPPARHAIIDSRAAPPPSEMLEARGGQ